MKTFYALVTAVGLGLITGSMIDPVFGVIVFIIAVAAAIFLLDNDDDGKQTT